MERIALKIVSCCVISFSLSAFIYNAAAQDETGALSSKDVPENEVVIHAPDTNLGSSERGDNEDKEKDDGSVDNDVASPDDLESANYDQLMEYLEKEKEYLKKLDEKFKSLGADGEDEEEIAESNDIASNGKKANEPPDDKESEAKTDQTSQLNAGLEEPKEMKSEKEEKIAEDEDVKDDLADADNIINYDNPFDTAEVFYEMGKYKEAMDAYKSLKNDAPNVRDFIWSQFQIGNCYRNLKQFDNAAKEYQNFINKYPDSFWADQALWYIEDSKWWKEWNNRISVKKETP